MMYRAYSTAILGSVFGLLAAPVAAHGLTSSKVDFSSTSEEGATAAHVQAAATLGTTDMGRVSAYQEDTTLWTIRAGVTFLRLADKVDLNVGGAPYPGTALSTKWHATPTIQVGRFLTPHVALNLTLGLPPTIDVYGGGSIAALPKLGKVTYGPVALTAQYHLVRSGVVRPYVGAGAAYMIVFKTKDGAFQNLRVTNDLGPIFEAGTDIMFRKDVGVFLDAKKALLRPRTTGSFFGAPVEGKTRLDPWALSAGVAYHF